MNVRDCVGKTIQELSALGYRDISSVDKSRTGYHVIFRTGDIVETRGHAQVEDVKIPERIKSDYKIQRYGQWGTSI
jgi:phosphoribosylformylglycinamidine (FGAM) synthase PurS component